MKVPLLACTALIMLPSAALGRTIVVNQKNARAADRNPGTEAQPLRTISAAAELAQSGDSVLVHGGVYRERVSPARGGEEGRPITYVAAPGEQVLVKGSDEWRPAWQPVAGHPGVWSGKLDPAMFGDFNPFHLDVNLSAAAPGSNKQVLKKVRPAPGTAPPAADAQSTVCGWRPPSPGGVAGTGLRHARLLGGERGR